MKQLACVFGTTALCLTAWLSPAWAQSPSRQPHIRALLVAVNGYGRGNLDQDAADLNTTPDVDALQKVLEQKFAGKPFEIKVLKTKDDTTHNNIVSTFRSFLIKQTQPGDIVIFHYSGHGSQVPDKDDVTGWDQTLVPSDYAVQDGSRDIRDKDIAELLGELKSPEHHPGYVFLSFDSCHSGTITRNGPRARAYERVFPVTNPEPVPGSGEKVGGLLSSNGAAYQGYVVLSACRSDQVDSELRDEKGRLMGSLSYALCHALTDATDKTTARDIADRVISILQEKKMTQEAQVEGAVDTELFGTEILKPEASILVDVQNDKPILKAGELMGMTAGTRLDIFARDQTALKTAKPIATAQIPIGGVHSLTCDLTVNLEPGHKLPELRGAPALVTERAFSDTTLRVDARGIQDHPRKDALMAKLKDLETNGLIRLETGPEADGADVRLLPLANAVDGTLQVAPVEGKARVWSVEAAPSKSAETLSTQRFSLRGADPRSSGSLVLVRRDGAVTDPAGSFLMVERGKNDYLQVLPDDDNLPDLVHEALRHESRKSLLNSLAGKAGEAQFKIEMHVIPCTVKADADGNLQYDRDLPAPPAGSGELSLPAGSYFRVELHNTGPAPAYVSILDLQSDGVIGPLWPDPRLGAAINLVSPGGWIPIHVTEHQHAIWRLTEPTGLETYMVIGTLAPADFSPLMDAETLSRGGPQGNEPGAREMHTPLGKLLLSAGQATRRSDPVTISIRTWSAFSFHVNVTAAGSASF